MKCRRDAVIRIATGLRSELPDFPPAGTACSDPVTQPNVRAT